ncbi:hypothetical protein RD792_011768 [Penstemon davidsonii]|uniref:RanBP2-type domain-containing protein n=1 Tax=Penstemon davidsonii TaxID=160366 RepID=A0ABR0CW10_9LAMI|nr:hypothetical protein RD792_011768 [Penstemon davidsonii]
MAARGRLVMYKYKVCDVNIGEHCGNVNFAFRGVCNRCGTARPAGASGGGAMGGGRGRGRGGHDLGGHSRAATATGGGLFGPNDWTCPMCGNINWAKRMTCNICNTNKPGHNEGGVRGGRGGGYKELDEEEIEETRRHRREAEEDDGEMFNEFGNLKKKFRAKTQQAEMCLGVPGVGRAGWEIEELGSCKIYQQVIGLVEGTSHYKVANSGRGERDRRERSKERGRDRDERERGRHRSREREDRHMERGRGHEYNDRYREDERERDRSSRYRS